MAIKYGKMIFSAKSGKDGVYTYDGGLDAGSCGYCVITVSATNDATDLSHIGAVSSAAGTTSPIILGIVDQGTPLTQSEATPFTKGAIVVKNVSILTSGTFGATGGATATLQAYRLYSINGTTTGWGSYRMQTGVTASVTHVVKKGGSSSTRIYDVSTISTASVITDTAAIDCTTLLGDRPQILRSGDLLCLSMGAGAITAGVGVMSIQIEYERLNKNARINSCGSRYDGNIAVTAT
jgi:hypothetical protein